MVNLARAKHRRNDRRRMYPNTFELQFSTCRYFPAISIRENKSNICKSFASAHDGAMIREEGAESILTIRRS